LDINANDVKEHEYFVQRTIDVATESVLKGGRPFSCIIVRDGNVIEESASLVHETHDPTAHAEICAIRNCCHKLETEFLHDCDIYILAAPNPMCLGALYYCCPRNVYYINQREEYSEFYTDDTKYFNFNGFYDEFNKPLKERKLPMHQLENPHGIEVFKLWKKLNSI